MTSSTAFKTLGVPIEGLLFILDSEVPDDDLTLLSKITVRQLAKVFDMTASGEDPEKILAWLRCKAQPNGESYDLNKEIERRKKAWEVHGAERMAGRKEKPAEKKAKAEAIFKEKDRADLANTFERPNDSWWKKNDYRRDFGKKGVRWKGATEHATEPATPAELASREEWFKSQGSWKSDKYRNDWRKSRYVEWGKETAYIKDWQDSMR